MGWRCTTLTRWPRLDCRRPAYASVHSGKAEARSDLTGRRLQRMRLQKMVDDAVRYEPVSHG
jgi:hypothetical protein